jgi:hypothetical protein
MWMQDERSGEPTEEQPSISHTFRQVYRFILRAMQGDTAVARALFQQYLAGELPDFIAALRARRSSGAACKKIKKAGRFAKSTVPPRGNLTPAAGEFADFGGPSDCNDDAASGASPIVQPRTSVRGRTSRHQKESAGR